MNNESKCAVKKQPKLCPRLSKIYGEDRRERGLAGRNV